ncbi:MAG TPA: branched-chain amino acid ABC transporter permease [Xanthobacteraceae bacterium]|nr:branched-chain amino acid ABC transporter permease [Xanthobacteraceae bacterium]
MERSTGARARQGTEFAVSLVILAAVAVLPLAVANDYWRGVVIVSMYFAMLAAAWNLLAGYTGQFSLAPAAFAMIGAYATGLLAYHFGAPPLVGIPAAIVVAGIIGFALGRIVLRLTGPYLALTTLSFAEIMRLVISNSIDITRGDLGLNVPALFDNRLASYYLMLGVLAATQVGLFMLLRRPAGLYLRAIRDDEIAAVSRGVKVVLWKTNAFVISAAISGLAGALYGHFAGLVSPELGLIGQTGIIVSMVVIGGLGTLPGPIIGAFLVYIASEYLRDFGGAQLIIFALLVIIFGRFFREGLWGLIVRPFTRPARQKTASAAPEP